MRPLSSAVALGPVLAFLTACGDRGSPTAATLTPHDGAIATAASAQERANGSDISVNLMDACDPVTFNAVLGPGTCVRRGGMTFSQFIAELTRHHDAGAWHFAPPAFLAEIGQTIGVTNRGGETHTFTEVAAFGGGFVAALNALSGNPTPRPECATVSASGALVPRPPSATNLFVPPGGTASLTTGGALLPAGQHLFQCCIHPWMRATAQVR